MFLFLSLTLFWLSMDNKLKYSINAREIRTGNILYNRRKRVVSIYPFHIDLLFSHEIYKYSKTPPFRGIPIDTDFIRDLGFVYNATRCYLDNDIRDEYCYKDFRIDFRHNDLSFKIYFRVNFEWIPLKKVVFVHQIQNLIFELSNEMLTLKKLKRWLRKLES